VSTKDVGSEAAAIATSFPEAITDTRTDQPAVPTPEHAVPQESTAPGGWQKAMAAHGQCRTCHSLRNRQARRCAACYGVIA